MTLDEIGQNSIVVFALNRPELCAERERHARNVLLQIERIADALLDVDADPADQRAKARLQKEVAVLKRIIADDEPFAALGRALAAGFLRQTLAKRLRRAST